LPAADIGTLLELQADETTKGKTSSQLSLKILQQTNGPVPRPHLPTMMVVTQMIEKDVSSEAVYEIIEEGMRWFLDVGGRAPQLDIACDLATANTVESMGFTRNLRNDADAAVLRNQAEAANQIILSCDVSKFKDHCTRRIKENKGNLFNLHDITGRLLHILGEPRAAIDQYTSALLIDPKSAAAFRNLGSAYQAAENMQMAFASYQQSIQLDEKGEKLSITFYICIFF
jgi:tetratricopeptide (TPR) repeat protein